MYLGFWRLAPRKPAPLQGVGEKCASEVSKSGLAELLYGLQESSKKKTNQAGVDALVRHVTVMEWPAKAAEHYAEIRADLRRKGQSIGANDLMIAAHARSEGAIVVTNNVKDFGRVKGLKVENWTT